MTGTIVNSKTSKGQHEVQNCGGDLSMAQRRPVILADGKRSAGSIGRFSRVEKHLQLLKQLQESGYLEVVGEAKSREAAVQAPGSFDDARQFMANSVQTFTSPFRSAGMIEKLQVAETKEELGSLIQEWCNLIAENPDSLQRVDELKAILLEKLV